MFTSFSTALSALSADSIAIDVVGNNLANLNTVGYKTNDVSFHDLVTQSMGSGSVQVGFGVGQPVTMRQFTQGALQTTSGPLDAAIQGDGFFVVQGASGSTEFTRAGNFQVDKNGVLTTATGEQVMGWTLTNGVLNTSAPPASIVVPVGSISAPVATGSMAFNINLDAAASAGPPAATFSSAVKTYDSLGNSHVVTVNFTKDAKVGQWDYSISVPDGDVKSAIAPVTGTLTFDASGHLTSPAATDASPAIKIQGLADGAADMNVNWNLYNGTTANITQFAQPSAVSATTQDGSAAAQLVSVGIGSGGSVLAQYSDGTKQTVGQVAMALIRNPESLLAVGNNNFQVSAATAAPSVGIPGAGGRGTVTGGALESSTVDIAREFTNLIVFQRAYQASSKVVTTVDQLSQDTIALKT